MFLGKPILIQRLSETEFRVFEMIAAYRGPGGGCGIRRGGVPVGHPAAEAVEFIDPCRGSYYDDEGNVLPGSMPNALPMTMLEWQLKDGYLYLQSKAIQGAGTL